jgi:uncharacterized protein YlbG (UPF0298 family)
MHYVTVYCNSNELDETLNNWTSKRYDVRFITHTGENLYGFYTFAITLQYNPDR